METPKMKGYGQQRTCSAIHQLFCSVIGSYHIYVHRIAEKRQNTLSENQRGLDWIGVVKVIAVKVSLSGKSEEK